jgi:hypothetical protein
MRVMSIRLVAVAGPAAGEPRRRRSQLAKPKHTTYSDTCELGKLGSCDSPPIGSKRPGNGRGRSTIRLIALLSGEMPHAASCHRPLRGPASRATMPAVAGGRICPRGDSPGHATAANRGSSGFIERLSRCLAAGDALRGGPALQTYHGALWSGQRAERERTRARTPLRKRALSRAIWPGRRCCPGVS